MEFAAHQLVQECLACALETRLDIQSLPYLEDHTMSSKRMENRDFLNHKSRKKEETRHPLCLRHDPQQERHEYHTVKKNSPKKKLMEMSLSSSGMMLKSYFSYQDRKSVV